MANVMSHRFERATSDTTLLELDKAGVILGFLLGLVGMIAYQHAAESPSALLSAGMVALATWAGLRVAQGVSRVLR
jgi:hypothetical protein